MKKRLLSLVLVVAMVATMLMGCGGDASTDSGAAAGKQPRRQATDTAPAAAGQRSAAKSRGSGLFRKLQGSRQTVTDPVHFRGGKETVAAVGRISWRTLKTSWGRF